MSIDKVLEMPSNVRNLEDVPRHDESPVWERITPGQVMINFSVNPLATNIFAPEYGVKEPDVALHIARDKAFLGGKRVIGSIERRQAAELNDIGIEYYLMRSAQIRLLERDFTSDLDNESALSYTRAEIDQLSMDIDRGTPPHFAKTVNFLFDFKLNFPLLRKFEVTRLLGRFFENSPDAIDTMLSSTDDTLVEQDLGVLAMLKILDPEKLKGMEITSSPIYQRGIELAEQDIDKYSFPNLSIPAYLKILAAEKAVIGPRGIELTMPEKDVEVDDSPPLPETRRFGK